MQKVTISVIKADIGGLVGHSSIHPEIVKLAEELLAKAKVNQDVCDFRVAPVGDDLNLILTHFSGTNSEKIHKLAWDIFQEGTKLAQDKKMYGAGQDLLAESFSGNVRGMGPGVAEMEIAERKSEPVIIFMADKTAPSAWNLPLFKMFADPFNTAGLIIDPSMNEGFVFEVHDLIQSKKIKFSLPEELYDILTFIGSRRFCIKYVYNKKGEIAAAASTEKLSLIAGKYVGKDDPVMIVRCQSGFPAVGEALEPFAVPHLVEGWMRGSHIGPLMPCALHKAHPTRFDGPPRVVALGFQVSKGTLEGPVDLFDDVAFDKARNFANQQATYLRRHGPFEPHRLPLEDMEYTSLPKLTERYKDRFEKIED